MIAWSPFGAKRRGIPREVAIFAVLVLLASTGVLADGGISSAASIGTRGTSTGNPATIAPPWRWAASMAFDPKDGYSVLFGGYSGSTLYSDTWTYRAGNWTEIFPSVHPSGRGDGSMAYDPKDAGVVLFGGQGTAGYLHDTWKFSAGNWTHLRLSGFPSGRSGAALVYDAADGYLLLFGGANASGQLSDTWAFYSGSWHLLHPATSPPARREAAIAYDAADGYVVLFGGLGAADLNDTWTFHAGVWTQISSGGAPGVRVSPAAAYDRASGRVVLFGGRDDNTQTVWNDTWTFHAGRWTEPSLPRQPPGRDWPAIAYDSSAKEVVVFGGASGFYPLITLNDTWIYRAGAWS